MFSPTMEKASSGVHSAEGESKKACELSGFTYLSLKMICIVPFFVGFDIANMAGLVDVEPFIASNT